jgi:hypothetical protein
MKPRLALQKLLKKHLPRDPNRERSEEQQREDRCRDADERREQQQGMIVRMSRHITSDPTRAPTR